VINPRAITAVLLLLVVAGSGWFWYQSEPAIQNDRVSAGVADQTAAKSAGAAANTAPHKDSPFALQGRDSGAAVLEATGSSTTSPVESRQPDKPAPQNESLSDSSVANPANALPPVDVSIIGQSPINDTEFNALVERLRADSQLLQQLIDEFRQETDPQRLTELSRLLGEVGGPDVTLSASELIFSGDAQSRQLGLELLQQVQPGNSDARDIVSGLLATEVEPDVLVGTLTTLASPGDVEDVARANLSEQVAYLTQHDDASVRAISLNILSRWTTDSRYTAVLLDGLDDSIPTVRESAAYALVGHEDPSQDVLDSLFVVMDNSQEQESVRRGAILALKGMALSDPQRSHIRAVERALDSRPR